MGPKRQLQRDAARRQAPLTSTANSLTKDPHRTIETLSQLIAGGCQQLSGADLNDFNVAIAVFNRIAEARETNLFAYVGRAKAAHIISIWSFFLQTSPIPPLQRSPDQDVSAGLHLLRKGLGRCLTGLAVSTPPFASGKPYGIFSAFLGAQGLRRGSRLLSGCADDLKRSPSRRNKEAALARLQEVTPALDACGWFLQLQGGWGPSALLRSAEIPLLHAYAELFATEVRCSQVHESWASCFLHLSVSEQGGGLVRGGSSELLLSNFTRGAAPLYSSSLVADAACSAAYGPALGHLWSSLAVSLAAALDGGTLYGVPEELASALLPADPDRLAAGSSRSGSSIDVSPDFACQAMMMWGRMLWRQRVSGAGMSVSAQPGPANQVRTSAGTAAGVEPPLQQSGALCFSSALLPYNTQALYGLCMRLARSGIAAWGGQPTNMARPPSAVPPTAAAAVSRRYQRARLSKEGGMQLAMAALRCADEALRVRASQVAASKAASQATAQASAQMEERAAAQAAAQDAARAAAQEAARVAARSVAEAAARAAAHEAAQEAARAAARAAAHEAARGAMRAAAQEAAQAALKAQEQAEAQAAMQATAQAAAQVATQAALPPVAQAAMQAAMQAVEQAAALATALQAATQNAAKAAQGAVQAAEQASVEVSAQAALAEAAAAQAAADFRTMLGAMDPPAALISAESSSSSGGRDGADGAGGSVGSSGGTGGITSTVVTGGGYFGAGGMVGVGGGPNRGGAGGEGGGVGTGGTDGSKGVVARPARVNLAALEEWVQALSDASVLAVGPHGVGTSTDPSLCEVPLLISAQAEAVRDLLRALRQAAEEKEAALDAAVADVEAAVRQGDAGRVALGSSSVCSAHEAMAVSLSKMSSVVDEAAQVFRQLADGEPDMQMSASKIKRHQEEMQTAREFHTAASERMTASVLRSDRLIKCGL